MRMAHAAESRWGARALDWWFGLGHVTLGLNWIATSFTYQVAMPVWLGWVAVLLLSLFLAIYPAVATGLAWRFGRGDVFRFTLLFAAAWMLTEWLRRSEEHTSELQSLMRISYAVFCLHKQTSTTHT